MIICEMGKCEQSTGEPIVSRSFSGCTGVYVQSNTKAVFAHINGLDSAHYWLLNHNPLCGLSGYDDACALQYSINFLAENDKAKVVFFSSKAMMEEDKTHIKKIFGFDESRYIHVEYAFRPASDIVIDVKNEAYAIIQYDSSVTHSVKAGEILDAYINGSNDATVKKGGFSMAKPTEALVVFREDEYFSCDDSEDKDVYSGTL